MNKLKEEHLNIVKIKSEDHLINYNYDYLSLF